MLRIIVLALAALLVPACSTPQTGLEEDPNFPGLTTKPAPSATHAYVVALEGPGGLGTTLTVWEGAMVRVAFHHSDGAPASGVGFILSQDDGELVLAESFALALHPEGHGTIAVHLGGWHGPLERVDIWSSNEVEAARSANTSYLGMQAEHLRYIAPVYLTIEEVIDIGHARPEGAPFDCHGFAKGKGSDVATWSVCWERVE